MTYINKEELIREIDKLKVAGVFTEAFKLAVMTVIQHQRAADVERVVRCKDCECFIPTCETHGVCDLNSSSKAINEFCSEGELKGGAEK